MEITNLSANARKLYQAMKEGPIWEDKAINVLFPPPAYIASIDLRYPKSEIRNAQMIFWQYIADRYGHSITRPVFGISQIFYSSANYAAITHAAFLELKNAGIICSRNDGVNYYSYHLNVNYATT